MFPYAIVIPILNDAPALAKLLESLGEAGLVGACVVADGGSRDGSVMLAKGAGCKVIECGAGRATQMRRAIELAGTQWIWMLHADTVVPPAAAEAFEGIVTGTACWGRFDVRLDGKGVGYRVIEAFMNVRSALTGICTGDQGIFAHSTLLEAIAGVPDQPLMEDIELSRRLKRLMRPVRMREVIFASARRWQARGIVRTVLLMWALRLAYFIGVSPTRLHQIYYRG